MLALKKRLPYTANSKDNRCAREDICQWRPHFSLVSFFTLYQARDRYLFDRSGMPLEIYMNEKKKKKKNHLYSIGFNVKLKFKK